MFRKKMILLHDGFELHSPIINMSLAKGQIFELKYFLLVRNFAVLCHLKCTVTRPMGHAKHSNRTAGPLIVFVHRLHETGCP